MWLGQAEGREELLRSSRRNPLLKQAGQAAAARTRGPHGVSAPVKEPRVICHQPQATERRVARGGGGGQRQRLNAANEFRITDVAQWASHLAPYLGSVLGVPWQGGEDGPLHPPVVWQ